MKLLTIIILFQIFNLSAHYRILGLFPLPVKSHMIMFEKLMEGLARNGHEVHVVSQFPRKTPIPGYIDIPLSSTSPVINNISISFARRNMATYFDALTSIVVNRGIVQSCKEIFDTSAARRLKNSTTKYDLVITEIFGSDCMLGFAHQFQVPVIGITSSVSLPWGCHRIGNPDNPSYIPNYFVPFASKMSLRERVVNTIVLLLSKYRYFFSSETTTSIAREFFGENLPHLSDLARNTSLIFVNSHFSINHARPLVPNFIEVGGLHIETLKPLSDFFENALNLTDKYKGVIYFSMGSILSTESISAEKLAILFQTFRKLPYKVLWKSSLDSFPKHLNIPSNIHFIPWMPQLEILCHPNVKLFISHGGLMATQEAIFCGVPSLIIPIFADQKHNAKASEVMGHAIVLNYPRISKKKLTSAINALLEHSKYKENAERASRLFKDRPLSPLDTAIYWVEYVIRHGGAPHLRTVGADLSCYVGSTKSNYFLNCFLNDNLTNVLPGYVEFA